jgi:hypothetical protein
MEQLNRAHGYLPAAAFTRTERIVIDDDGFYFKTRENGIVGPYTTESFAINELQKYVLTNKLAHDLKAGYY